MKPTVFIHTNDKQLVGAKIAAYSFKARSKNPDAFDVRLLRLEDLPHLTKREGETYLRKGREAVWHNDDLQSFSPVRMAVPQVMGFQGRAVVTDPDVFAVGDIHELFTMDMGDKPIWCRHVVDGYKGNGNRFYASSMMLLDCSRLTHWKWDEQIDDMFAKKWDYGPWIGLLTEDPSSIGELDEAWNSFDKLTPETRLLHNTERSTQPWKTGLPVDFDTTWKKKGKAAPAAPAGGMWNRLIHRLLGKGVGGAAAQAQAEPEERYQPHPDPAQVRFFFGLLKEALQTGAVTEDFLREAIAQRHIRPDAMEVMESVAG